MVSVAETISGGRALGRITRQMMLPSPAPMARMALTYSSVRMRRNSERVSRAVCGQLTMPMASATLTSVGWNSVTTTMANSSGGSTWKNSVTRISMSSTMPP